MANSKFVEGVNILAKHMPEDKANDYNVNLVYDQIWFGGDDWVKDEKDIKRLEELGWFIDEDSWSYFP